MISLVLHDAALVVPVEHVGLENEEPAFHNFIQRYRRPYKHGSDEYNERLQLFKQRASQVEQLNKRSQRLWTAGVNKLSDRTEAELAELRGWRGIARSGGASGARSAEGTFLTQRGRGKPLASSFNWTALKAASSVVDQGGCGSCWAVASSKVLEAHAEIYNPRSQRSFSAQELVSCVPNPRECGGTGGCEGATVELAFHWALNHGLAPESETPYQGITGECKKSGSLVQLLRGNEAALEDVTRPGVHMARNGAPGLKFGMHGWERLPENSYEALLRATSERGPVGVSVAAQAWASYANGIFDDCEKDSIIDHAVVLMGYGKDEDTGALFYLVQNSWGPEWGEQGRIRLLRQNGDEEHCGVDRQPEAGTGCRGGPKEVKVCGMCGILYDASIPHFVRL